MRGEVFLEADALRKDMEEGSQDPQAGVETRRQQEVSHVTGAA